MAFIEIYAEGHPTEFLDAFEYKILSLGGKRGEGRLLGEASDYLVSSGMRGKMASLLLRGEDVFFLTTPEIFAAEYCKQQLCKGGVVGDAGDKSSIHMRWLEFESENCTLEISNQNATEVLPELGDNEEYSGEDVVRMLDEAFGKRSVTIEDRVFGPGIITWPDGALVQILKKNTGRVVLPAFGYFKAKVNNEPAHWSASDPAALQSEMDDLFERAQALKPLEVINLADMVYLSITTMPAYQTQNPSTGEIIEVPAKAFPILRRIRRVT